MEIILLQKIDNLGDLGDKVQVKNGYGRNFLIPSGRAVPATAENVERLEARRAELEKEAAVVLAAAEAAVALAIALSFYNSHASIDVDRADELRG